MERIIHKHVSSVTFLENCVMIFFTNKRIFAGACLHKSKLANKKWKNVY
jgi:hypothetical protein